MTFPGETHTVGIIGAGISGIAAAKQLAGHDPVVLEATDSIGGVWRHCSFSSTKLQTPRLGFQFSDFPWPESVTDDFPTRLEVVDYLHRYASHFDVLKYVKLNSRAVEIRHARDDRSGPTQSPACYGALLSGRPRWEVAVQENQSESLKWYAFEMLVVCAGNYGDVPRTVSFPANKGPEVFEGKVLHTMDYSNLGEEEAPKLLRGKKVAIVGYKKSALDLAMECALANQGLDGKACAMVIRTPRWSLPSDTDKIWGLPLSWLFSTRTSQFLYHKPNQSSFMSLLYLLSSPLKRAVSKFVESYLLWKLPLEKYGVKPEHSFADDFAACQMSILPANFFSEVGYGRIVLVKKSQGWWFWEKGLEFEDKTRLDADVVVLATGFDGAKKLRDLLPEPFSGHLVDSSGIVPLYRGTIHPLIPNMAFVGYVESFSNLAAAELQSIWVARLADDMFELPSIDKMLEQTREEEEVMKKTTRFYKKQCFSTFSIHFFDQICHEMGFWPSKVVVVK